MSPILITLTCLTLPLSAQTKARSSVRPPSTLPGSMDVPQMPDTDTLYAIWQVHVDPGPPWNETQDTFNQGCFILNAMADVFESHDIPMYVAVSWNFSDACREWDPDGLVLGSVGNLVSRGHEIGLHQHQGASLQEQYDLLLDLTDTAPVSFDGIGDYDTLENLGFQVGGVGPGKDVSTQLTENGTRSYRPSRENGFEFNPDGALLAIQGGSFEGQSYEPDETENMTIALDYDMARMVPGKLHTWVVATHPDESLGLSDAQVLADMAKIDQWLTTEIDPRIDAGTMTWTTKRDFLRTYKQWEFAGGDHDDIFPDLPGITQPGWSALTTASSGIVSDYIASIDTIPGGDAWFGAGRITGGGLSELTGAVFTTHVSQPGGILSNKPLFLFRDSSGVEWASMATEPTLAGNLGFSAWNGSTWANHPAITLGFPGGSPGFVWEVSEDPSGRIWAGTGAGVARFNGTGWTTFTPNNTPLSHERVYRVAVDDVGRKWFGTLGGGIDILDTSAPSPTWTNIDQPTLPSGTIRAIHFDFGGNAWVGTQRGAAFFDGVDWTIYNETNSGLVHDHVTAIFVDSDGEVWFGTYGRGVSRYDPASGSWNTYSNVTGELSGRHVLDIDEDANGNILFAMYQGGGVGVFEKP